VPGDGAAGAVEAALLDPVGELVDRRLAGVEGDGRSLGDRVRLDREYSAAAAEHALDDLLLARVVEIADVQDRPRAGAVFRH
jgi:hypothetical protein